MRSIICLSAFTGLALAAALPAAAQIGLPPTANLLLRYDTDQNGEVSRAEMESGLAADYALSDADGNACINGAEMRVENDLRLERDGGVASPVADWNLDGCVDMVEFGSSVRSYFNFADHSKDNMVDTAELRGPSMPIGLPQVPQAAQDQGPSQMGTTSVTENPYDSSVPGNF
jgi:hypothetical protein